MKLYEINVYGPTFSADGKVHLAVYAGFGDPVGMEREPFYDTVTDLPVAGYYDEWYCVTVEPLDDADFSAVTTYDKLMPEEVLEILLAKVDEGEISW